MVAFLKILLAFGAMLAGVRYKFGLSWSILLGSFVLTMLFGQGVGNWLESVVEGLFYPKTFYLAGIVGGIMALSMVMERTVQAERLMEALSGFLHRPRVAVAFFPALIGLLPMPGGAVFSAPMVKRFAGPLALSPEQMSAVNYWFRHVWELAWPLYPGVILCASLAGVPVVTVCAYLLFTPAVAIGLGWWLLLPKQQDGREAVPKPGANARRSDLRIAWLEGAPIVIAIAGGLALEGLIAVVGVGIAYEWGILVALVWATRAALKRNGVEWREAAPWFLQKKLASMLMVILAIFIFKAALDGTGAITDVAQSANGAAAVFFTAWLLPFLVGAIAGMNVAFVGAVFPLLLALIESVGLQDHTMAYLALGMLSGMSGILISPLHLCFILTCQYFHADAVRTWRLLLWPCLLLLGSGVLYFGVLFVF